MQHILGCNVSLNDTSYIYCSLTGESPKSPIVPGPVISANTFTRANAPEIMPKPSPETEKIIREN